MIEFHTTTSDPRALRSAFGSFPSGVTAVCALVDGRPVGMAASSFTSVSLDPPLVSVCFQHTSATWPLLRSHGRLGVSILAEHQNEVCRQLSRTASNRFDDVAWEATSDGAVLLHDSAAWLDCTLDAEIPAGDHTIALLHIDGFHTVPDTAPLVFHDSRFRRLASA